MIKPLSSTISLCLLSGAAVLTPGVYAASPKIVVGIVVDQLRTDYIEQLRPYFGTGGFNRLIGEGVYLQDVDFRNAASDSPTGAAIVYTGAWPVVNGVAGAETADPTLRRNVPVLSDRGKTKAEYSPENLRVSTIADEFVINSGSLSKVYSVGADPQTAVIAAGHGGTGAVWLDEAAGKWAVPSYYVATPPPAIANRNRLTPPASKASSMSWRPINQASAYDFATPWNGGDFCYTFSGADRDGLKRFKASAPFLAETTDVAIDLLKSMKSAPAGMLSVEYSASPYSFDFDGDNRPELTDTYVRLDSEIGRLLDAVIKEYGKENTFVFLSSTGYAIEPEIPESAARIPTGEVTLKQVESLLNSYLSASYGNADYVTQIKSGKLFLNGAELSRKGIDIKNIRSEVKRFLMKMSGVSEALTIDDILTGADSRAQGLSLGIDPKNAPDVFIFFNPGWTVTDDYSYPPVDEKIRLATPATPAFLFGLDLAPEKIASTVEATALAPTIASEIHIRAPNAAASKPLALNKKNKN